MRRKPKTEVDPPEPYRHYRVPDGSVDDATAADTHNTCVVVVMIGLSIVSIGFYVAIFAVVALVLAILLGLIDWPFG